MPLAILYFGNRVPLILNMWALSKLFQRCMPGPQNFNQVISSWMDHCLKDSIGQITKNLHVLVWREAGLDAPLLDDVLLWRWRVYWVNSLTTASHVATIRLGQFQHLLKFTTAVYIQVIPQYFCWVVRLPLKPSKLTSDLLASFLLHIVVIHLNVPFINPRRWIVYFLLIVINLLTYWSLHY